MGSFSPFGSGIRLGLPATAHPATATRFLAGYARGIYSNVAHKGRAGLRGVSAQRDGTFIAYAHKMRRMHFRCGIKTREEAIAAAKALRAELMTHQNEERHQ